MFNNTKRFKSKEPSTFNPKLSFEMHSETGATWFFGTEHAAMMYGVKPTKNELRKLRKLSYIILKPLHEAAERTKYKLEK